LIKRTYIGECIYYINFVDICINICINYINFVDKPCWYFKKWKCMCLIDQRVCSQCGFKHKIKRMAEGRFEDLLLVKRTQDVVNNYFKKLSNK